MKEPEEAGPDDLRLLVQVIRSLGNRSQADLAAAAGVTERTIRRAEKGKTSPSRTTVERLALAAGLPLAFIESSLLPTLRAARRFASTKEEEAPVVPGPNATESIEAVERLVSSAVRAAVAGWEAARPGADDTPRRSPIRVEEDRRTARTLWERIAACTAEERLFVLENGSEFHTWALAELIFIK